MTLDPAHQGQGDILPIVCTNRVLSFENEGIGAGNG